MRRRLAEIGDRDLMVEDDGRIFTFSYSPRGAEPCVLRWEVDDETLARICADGDAEARVAWGTKNADGLYFVINWIEEAVNTFPGHTGHLELVGRELRAVSD